MFLFLLIKHLIPTAGGPTQTIPSTAPANNPDTTIPNSGAKASESNISDDA